MQYTSQIHWQRNDAHFDPKSYNRTHSIQFPGGHKMNASSAPEYAGSAEFPNPEELFTASLSSCFMLTFLYLAAMKGIVINTSHPGNIGSAARAMKTMGLSQLYLVAPLQFPHPKAQEMASGAQDLLANVQVVTTLDDALTGCSLILGTSARTRAIPWPVLSPREMADTIKAEPEYAQTAILFGCEQFGLTNDELQRCHFHIQIPSNPVYSSLNIASALQILAYELRLMSLDLEKEEIISRRWDYRLATADEMEKFFIHLKEALIEVDFLKMNAPRKLMTRLRRLFFRARPDMMEMNILRGMLSAFQGKIFKN